MLGSSITSFVCAFVLTFFCSAPRRGDGRGPRRGRGGRGGGGRNRDERPKKTAEDLDAEMAVSLPNLVSRVGRLLTRAGFVGLQRCQR